MQRRQLSLRKLQLKLEALVRKCVNLLEQEILRNRIDNPEFCSNSSEEYYRQEFQATLEQARLNESSLRSKTFFKSLSENVHEGLISGIRSHENCCDCFTNDDDCPLDTALTSLGDGTQFLSEYKAGVSLQDF